MDPIELFKKAAAALQTDSRYLALDAARRASDADEELQAQIGEFNLARLDLNNEIGKDDRDDQKITELNDRSTLCMQRSCLRTAWLPTMRQRPRWKA